MKFGVSHALSQPMALTRGGSAQNTLSPPMQPTVNCPRSNAGTNSIVGARQGGPAVCDCAVAFAPRDTGHAVTGRRKFPRRGAARPGQGLRHCNRFGQDFELGEVVAVEAPVPGEKNVCLGHCMSADEEICHDVLPNTENLAAILAV